MIISKKRTISFWYYCLGLGLISILVWFFLEVIAAPKAQQLTIVAKKMLDQPLESNFNQTVIDQVLSRQVILDVDLSNTKPYTQLIEVPETEVIVDVALDSPDLATDSAQPEPLEE